MRHAQGKRLVQEHTHEARKNEKFDSTIFGSREEQERYISNFSKRKVSGGKNLDFIQLVGLDLTTKFSAMKWIPLLQLVVPMYPILVIFFITSQGLLALEQ